MPQALNLRRSWLRARRNLTPIIAGVALLASVLAGCRALVHASLDPGVPFDAAQAPPPPDYTLPEAWSALPDRADLADVVPAGELDGQASAVADVFFVHPTTWYSDAHWNQPLDDADTNALTDRAVLRNQASVFNSAARVFVPRYRQATLFAFMTEAPDGQAALDLAYRDVEAAFDLWLQRHDRGGPFIIAGHSQGAQHALRLVAERISGTPLRDRLVAAYLIGFGIPTDVYTRLLPDIPVCAAARQTGCLVSWNTIGVDARRDRFDRGWIAFPGGVEKNAGKTLTCVNPLSWRADEQPAEAALHLGSVRFDERDGAAVEPMAATARCDRGLLVVENVPSGYGGWLGRLDDYHLVDIALFYMNLRRNAVDRVQAWLAQPSLVQLPASW